MTEVTHRGAAYGDIADDPRLLSDIACTFSLDIHAQAEAIDIQGPGR